MSKEHDPYENQTNELMGKLQALTLGIDTDIVAVACTRLASWALMESAIRHGMSVDKTCAAARMLAKGMQENIRARWPAVVEIRKRVTE
jgi:hypothetical protein